MAATGEPRIETGYVDVDGIRTFYRRLPGDGAPAVFVHGNPTHSADWMPFLAAMEGPALAFDLPGFGRSDRPDPSRFDSTMWSYGAFIGKAIEALGVAEHSLVVHDWGGAGLIAAQERPDRVTKVVVINAVPLLPGYRWHRTARIWRTPRLGELSNRLWSRRMLDLALRESRGDWSRHDPRFVDQVWDHLDAGTLDAILRLYRSADPPDLARAGARLGELDCPALVVWGMKDRYLPGRFGRAYADALGAELEDYPAAGHWPWIDDPAVVPRVTDFLAR